MFWSFWYWCNCKCLWRGGRGRGRTRTRGRPANSSPWTLQLAGTTSSTGDRLHPCAEPLPRCFFASPIEPHPATHTITAPSPRCPRQWLPRRHRVGYSGGPASIERSRISIRRWIRWLPLYRLSVGPSNRLEMLVAQHPVLPPWHQVGYFPPYPPPNVSAASAVQYGNFTSLGIARTA